MKNRMYKQNRKSLNWFVGCRHDCVYCERSFQAQMKRQLHNCRKCYDFVPHAHLERLQKAPPKTEQGEFIFFPSSGDPAFASKEQWKKAISFVEKYSDRTFLIQSKDPQCFASFKFPNNVILGTTIETDKIRFYHSPSQYFSYGSISNAVLPSLRFEDMLALKHKRKFVTIEPVLLFTFENWEIHLVDWMKIINPEFVYIGYDNHNCKLPEPALSDTMALIKQLEAFTEVRVKTLRKAWWE